MARNAAVWMVYSSTPMPTLDVVETAAIGQCGEATLAVGWDLVHSHVAELRADGLDPPTLWPLW